MTRHLQFDIFGYTAFVAVNTYPNGGNFAIGIGAHEARVEVFPKRVIAECGDLRNSEPFASVQLKRR